ncbi:MAG TPA: non-canonical purine NTP pyrophosphatase [Patescibacteria group bacterium]|nr:non-canonical purine NTP pyrophosphatase [Patescibacteria group bacterium]
MYQRFGESALPRVINHIVSPVKIPPTLLFATRNQNKLREYQRILKKPVEGIDLKVPEIQDSDPLKVLSEKAKTAYAIHGGPIFVEDTSFTLPELDNMIGPYADNETSSRAKLAAICRMFDTTHKREAIVVVGIALFDGREVYMWVGKVSGTVAASPLGSNGFGFDAIFIPKGAKKTFAQMTDSEKDSYSPRKSALLDLVKNPPSLAEPIFQLQEPSVFQTNRIRKEEIAKRNALQFAFSMESLEKARSAGLARATKPNVKLEVSTYAPFTEVLHYNGAVREYTVDPKSASMGLVLLTEVDLKTVPDKGKKRAIRLAVSDTGNPLLYQMGPKAMEIVLAARAAEYLDMHSADMHQHVRDLLSGKIQHVSRSSTRSSVLEEVLGMFVKTDEKGVHKIIHGASTAIATKELGYKRLSSGGILSRKQAAKGLLMRGPDGVVSSLYSYGGMPPTTGSRDSIVTAAMSFMRAWIPRNGVFAGNFARQLQLFKQAKKAIIGFGLPKDIEKQVISQIGIAVGCDNPVSIARDVKKFALLGGHAARIYTTNPDIRIIETAKAIRKATGPNFLLCVGPVTDYEQAVRLKKEAQVHMFLVGHGGGENCTSLTAGGAANSIELLYQLYLDPLFNDCIIGLEGGTGTTIGALLPLLDVISLNKRGIGGFESTQGLYALKARNGKEEPVIPYHGSASAATQLIEAYMSPEIAKKRLGPDGIVRAVEGKVNYIVLNDAVRSNVSAIRENRAIAGLALADQQSLSIYQLRERVKKLGHNHVGISAASSVVANEHRSGV